MRYPFALLMLLLPFAAVGQSAGNDNALVNSLLARQPDQMAPVAPGVMVPLWRSPDGRMVALKADHATGARARRQSTLPLTFHVVDAASVGTVGLQYGLSPSLQTHAEVSQYSWANHFSRVVGSEVGATYNAGRYSLGLSVGANSVPNSVALPRVLPGAGPSIDGLSGFDSSSQLKAHGRLALSGKSGIDLGASIGRIRLVNGNLLGVDTLDQKALSFGVDHGSLSGSLVGRTMVPEAGIPGSLNPDRRWNSIDLGVTWRLPWRGELSVGAQNLWSSGTPVNTPAGPEPDQSRTPYVQYHQDL
ncbi:MAG: hypothetical protein ABI114_13560 [Rhodanobacter sp.]